jgi:hypothetical protein
MTEFFRAGMEARRNVGGGRILLGDNTCGDAVMQRPIRFRRAGVWISTTLPCVYSPYIVDHMHTQIRLAQISTGAGVFGSLLLLKSGSVCSLETKTYYFLTPSSSRSDSKDGLVYEIICYDTVLST